MTFYVFFELPHTFSRTVRQIDTADVIHKQTNSKQTDIDTHRETQAHGETD